MKDPLEDPLRNPALSKRNAWNINRNINDFWKKEEEIRAKELVNDNFSRKQQGQSFGKSFLDPPTGRIERKC